MKMACLECKVLMQPFKVGLEFVEAVRVSAESPNIEARYMPYQLWSSDAYICPSCNRTVAYVQPKQGPILEHFDPGFVNRCEKAIVVWDRPRRDRP